MLDALSVAAEGGKAGIAKPMKGLGSGVFEVALPYRGNAFRVVYLVQLGDELWVIHAFQKKSTHGIKTPKHEIDLIEARLKRLREMLRWKKNSLRLSAGAETFIRTSICRMPTFAS